MPAEPRAASQNASVQQPVAGTPAPAQPVPKTALEWHQEIAAADRGVREAEDRLLKNQRETLSGRMREAYPEFVTAHKTLAGYQSGSGYEMRDGVLFRVRDYIDPATKEKRQEARPAQGDDIRNGQQWLQAKHAAEEAYAAARGRYEPLVREYQDLTAKAEAHARRMQEENDRAADETLRLGGRVEGHFLRGEQGIRDGLTNLAQKLAAAGDLTEAGFARAEKELSGQPGWDPARRDEYRRHFDAQQQQAWQQRADTTARQRGQAAAFAKQGFTGLSSQIMDLQTEAESRRAEILQSHPDPTVPEAQAALKTLEDEVAQKHSAIVAGAEGQLRQIAELYENWASRQDVPAWDLPTSAAPQITQAAAKLGIPEKDLRYWLEYHRRADWDKPLSKGPEGLDALAEAATDTVLDLTGHDTLKEKSRVLPDGAITINPVLHADKDAYEQAVRQAGGSRQAQAEALAKFPQLQREWAAKALPHLWDQAALPVSVLSVPRLWGGRPIIPTNFQEWREKKIGESQDVQGADGFLKLSVEDQVLQYVDEMKKRPGWLKYADTVTRNFVKGGGDLISGGLGLSALALGKVPGIGDDISAAAAAWSAENDRLTKGMEYKGQDSRGHRFAGTLASLLPQIGATVGTGGLAGGGVKTMALIAGSQAAGSQFAQTYGELMEKPGMTHQEAWNRVAPWAVGTGIVTGLLTAAGGKSGVEALARNPQVLKQTLGSAWKSFFKGAVKENLEEMPDELLSQISAALAVNPGADITATIGKFIKNSPELMLSVALLGGGGEMRQTLAENRQIRNGSTVSPLGQPNQQENTNAGQAPVTAPAAPNSPARPTGAQPLATSPTTAQTAVAAPAAPPAVVAPASQTPPTATPSTGAPSIVTPSTGPSSTGPSSTGTPPTAQKPPRTAAEIHSAYVQAVGRTDHPMAKKAEAGQRALEVMPPDQRAIFEKVFEMDAARHAAGIPSAIEYQRRMGGRIDPDVAAAHRWLDSFLPEEAPLQWRRMMGASGDRGKSIATVLHSPLGLGAQAAPNTVIPGSPMPVYSGARRGYRPPPVNVPRHSDVETARPPADSRLNPPALQSPQVQPAPAAPQRYTTANRPSLFGPLEARRDWALAKVRELETIAADPNRSQRDRDSARRGARQITRDIANYQGMPLTPEELNAEVNPLLSRMDEWGAHMDTPQSEDFSTSAYWVRGKTPLNYGDPKVATTWRKHLEHKRVSNPVHPNDVLSGWSGLDIPESFKFKVFRGMRSLLDLLPREIVESAGPFRIEILPQLTEDAPGLYNHYDRAIKISKKVLDTYDELQLRSLIWHEMAHWLYSNADSHPRLQKWKHDLEKHWHSRIAGEAVQDSGKGWKFFKDNWIHDYAGRVYPNGHGVEIPSVYLQEVAMGPERIADLLIIPKAQETFDIVTSIFGK